MFGAGRRARRDQPRVSTASIRNASNAEYPDAVRRHSAFDAFLMEAVLTLGLVSVILGTASGAQNIGISPARSASRGTLRFAGLWGSPISGASMNPARTFRPELSRILDFTSYWVYVAGPIVGVGPFLQWVQRGCSAVPAAAAQARSSAQGTFYLIPDSVRR